VRITIQLIDAITGHHLWAENYDRKFEDIFALQDEIAMKIMAELQVKLPVAEIARLASIKTNNLKAYEKFLKGSEHWARRTEADNIEARRLLQEAIALDPEYGAAYRILGYLYLDDIWFRRTKDRAETLRKAEQMAQKVTDLIGPDYSHDLLSNLFLMRKQYEKAIVESQKAVELYPNSAGVNFVYGMVLRFAGRLDEAIPVLKKAIRLNPVPPINYLNVLAWAYALSEQYEKAIPLWNRTIERNPDYLFAYMGLTLAYQLSGNEIKAREAAAEVLRIKPKFSIVMLKKGVRTKITEERRERLIEAFLKAGIPETSPLPLPDKPSIAVLAFDNLSGDPKQEFFSDGITENIISSLSKVGELFVISRNSSFTYKGKPVKIQQVSKELGVRYVVEGSVQKSGDRVRITAQLIDAKNGQHLWAEKYDRDLKDIFALQDEITKRIITALQVKLTEGEPARIRAEGTNNLEAYLKVLEARELFLNWKVGDNHKARQLLEEAIKLDPHYVYAYVVTGFTHIMDVYLDPTKSKKNSITRAFELSKKALSIDNSSGYAHMLSGNVNYLRKQYEKGIAEYEKAVELNPNSADSHAYLARGLDQIGKTEEAILMSKKAMRLNPLPPNWYIIHRTAMYRNIKNYKEALGWAEKAIQRQPQNFIARINLCSVYSLTGRMEEARLEANEVMKLNPKFSLLRLEKSIPYKNPEVKKRYIEALRNAGLPD
jgi:TolB-like protein/Tfp pilus assembly protein PilF